MRRPSAALVLSSAALFVALGGPAAAQETCDLRQAPGRQLRHRRQDPRRQPRRQGLLVERAPGAQDAREHRRSARPKLRPNAVRAAAIARGAVRSAELAAGAVRAPVIAAGAVGASKLGRQRRQLGRGGRRVAAGARPGAATRVTCSWTSGRSGRTRARRCRWGWRGAAEGCGRARRPPPANWPAPIQVTGVLGPGDKSISVLAWTFTGRARGPRPGELPLP